MNKKDLLLGALMMAQSAIAHSPDMKQFDMTTIDFGYGTRLLGGVIFDTEGRKYELSLRLEYGNFIGESDQQKTVFDFMGNASFLSGDSCQESFIPGAYDSDGNMIFQLVESNEKFMRYRGFTCNSTFTVCQSFDNEDYIELIQYKDDSRFLLTMQAAIKPSLSKENRLISVHDFPLEIIIEDNG